MNILIADDTVSDRILLRSYLKKMGHEVIDFGNGEDVVDHVSENYASLDLVIMDVMMPGIDGQEAARRIRALEDEEWLPIIFLSGQTEDKDLAAGIDAGGDDYLFKPVNKTVLIAKMHAMQRISVLRKNLSENKRRLERLVNQDGLTGAANRRYLDLSLDHELHRARREKLPLSVCMIDVDHFKRFNDSYGHLAGDECLKRIVSTISTVVRRSSDLVARYGGEEFCCILPNTPHQAAFELAEKIRSAIESCYITRQVAGKPASVTVSIGVATIVPDGDTTVRTLMARADKALYSAKASGRNQVQQQ